VEHKTKQALIGSPALVRKIFLVEVLLERVGGHGRSFTGAYYWVLGDQPACPLGWVDWDSDPGSWDVLLMVLGSTVR
jgi:hypothetical protein